MASWRLVDGRYPPDDPDDFPIIVISSEAELRQELARLLQLEPGIVSLTSPTNEALQIGIGGPLAGLRWYQDPRSCEPSREILADRSYSPNRVDFLAEGDSIAFWPEQLLPADQAVDIVVYFYNHQRLPDWVGWREWDAVCYKWDVKPAVAARSA